MYLEFNDCGSVSRTMKDNDRIILLALYPILSAKNHTQNIKSGRNKRALKT